jgi:2-C-methyl-D-erythritol 4-phosphate cytidylyltransferase
MSQQNRAVAVIVAGGQGTRMQNAVPKQFLPINGKPILFHTINAFVKAIPEIKIVLVLPASHFSYANEVLHYFEGGIDLSIVAGGASRFESVKNGLRECNKEDIIFVHDGVRPLISKSLIIRCYDCAIANGSAIPVVPIVDSIRKIEGTTSYTIDRTQLRAVQTPQTFKGSVLLPAFEQEYQDAFTDEANVVSAMGFEVHLVEGEEANLKITHPDDLIFATAIQLSRDAE